MIIFAISGLSVFNEWDSGIWACHSRVVHQLEIFREIDLLAQAKGTMFSDKSYQADWKPTILIC